MIEFSTVSYNSTWLAANQLLGGDLVGSEMIGYRGGALPFGWTVIQRLRFTCTPKGRREFVPRDQVFPLFSVCSLLLLLKNKQFYASFNHRNRSGLFLSAYFLF